MFSKASVSQEMISEGMSGPKVASKMGGSSGGGGGVSGGSKSGPKPKPPKGGGGIGGKIVVAALVVGAAYAGYSHFCKPNAGHKTETKANPQKKAIYSDGGPPVEPDLLKPSKHDKKKESLGSDSKPKESKNKKDDKKSH